MQWFDVDKAGLAKLLAERGAAFAVLELVQNALDTKADLVTIDLHKEIDGLYDLTVTDNDPTGFSNLAHAFTLFAESEKKGDATKRGRFNLGEKLVLALCDSATVRSTKGAVVFTEKGRRNEPRGKTDVGSVIALKIRLTDTDAAEVERLVKSVLFPEGIKVSFNNEVLQSRPAIRTFAHVLPTVAERENGTLYNTARKTEVRLVEPLAGEKPHLYELGIPVVEVDVPFHVDVQQKVPVGFNRDSIPPAYARALHVAVVNEATDLVAKGDTVSRGWAADALADPKIKPEAVKAILEAKYGRSVDGLVRYDPSDPDSRTEAQSRGLDVIGGRAFTPEQWENINKAGLVPAAGKVAPSRNSVLRSSDKEKEEAGYKVIPSDDLTEDQRQVGRYAVDLAVALLGKPVTVQFVKDKRRYAASWGANRLTFNLTYLPKAFWTSQVAVDEVVLHEVAHAFASDHLDHKYYEAGFRLGAKARQITLRLTDYVAGEVSYAAVARKVDID